MIKTRKDLTFYLKEDRKINGYSSYLKYIAGVYIGGEQARAYHFIKALRHAEYHLNNSKNLYHKLLFLYYDLKKKHLGTKYHIIVHYNTTGYGLRIMHISGGGGVALGFKKCGNYCSFNCGVIIGISGKGKKPVLGDHVLFQPGAKAFGDIKIGDYTYIQANCVVTKDVPDRYIVFQKPPMMAHNPKLK